MVIIHQWNWRLATTRFNFYRIVFVMLYGLTGMSWNFIFPLGLPFLSSVTLIIMRVILLNEISQSLLEAQSGLARRSYRELQKKKKKWARSSYGNDKRDEICFSSFPVETWQCNQHVRYEPKHNQSSRIKKHNNNILKEKTIKIPKNFFKFVSYPSFVFPMAFSNI